MSEPLYHTNPEIQSLKPINREDWLERAVKELDPLFIGVGLAVPAAIKVSCGWPSKLALSRKKRRIGECWTAQANVFISPYVADSSEVLAILVHELIHASLPDGTKHRSPFPRYCKEIGLEGKPTSTYAGERLNTQLLPIIEKLGVYPHAVIDSSEQHKTQTTRLRLYQCECPIKVRVASDNFNGLCFDCLERDHPELFEIVKEQGAGSIFVRA